MRYFVILSLLLITTTLFCGTPKAIQEIRKTYKTVVSNDQCHEIKTKTTLAAIGPQNTTIKYCFEHDQVDPENDPYLMRYTLRRVVVDYNIAGSDQIHREYLYNQKGVLIFYFGKNSRDTPKDYTNRYYFKKGNLIRTAIKAEGQKKSITKDLKFSKKRVLQSQQIQKRGGKHLQFFKAVVAIEKIDKL